MPLRSDAAELRTHVKEHARTGWTHIANSWRLIAERIVAARTGGELSRLASVRPETSRPMNYQQSFFTLS